MLTAAALHKIIIAHTQQQVLLLLLLFSGVTKNTCASGWRARLKNPSLKIFMEHLEKTVSCVFLVLNCENRMKIRQEMAEVRTQNDLEIGLLSTF